VISAYHLDVLLLKNSFDFMPLGMV